MHFLPCDSVIESPRGALPRWVCALSVIHAVICAVGLTLRLL